MGRAPTPKRRLAQTSRSRRSPKYPALTLAESIDRVNRVYELEHTKAAAPEVIVKDLGYGSVNGASNRVLGALRRYGLLQTSETGLQVSDVAVTLCHFQRGTKERTGALETAAFYDPLFAALRNEFGKGVPSQAHMNHWLSGRKFLSKATAEISRIYRSNLEYLAGEGSGDPGGPLTPSARAGKIPQMDRESVPISDNTPNTASERGIRELHFSIEQEGEARILLNGRVTQHGIRKLIELLKLSIDTFPKGVRSES